MNRCAGNVEISPNGVCPHCGSGPNDRCGKFEYLSRAQMDARLAAALPRPQGNTGEKHDV